METKSIVPNLDCDGVSGTFFDILWAKDELNFGPDVNVPDTIIFRSGQPSAWFFTAKNGKLKKKSRQNMVLAKVEQSFMKHSLGYDIIATFVTVSDEKELSPSVVQFLDQKSFFDFLYDHSKTCSGILQRFIEPKGTKNETIRAIWSPKICLLERHENIYQLHDHRFGLYERCITYEGPEFYSSSSPIRGLVLAGQIQRVCEAIISHISEVTFGQITISRIVLNFKVDSRDKLWLLHTTSIRTIPIGSNTAPMSLTRDVHGSKTSLPTKKTLLNIDSTVSIPNHIHLNSSKSHSLLDANHKPKERESIQRCLSCGTETVESVRHPITYKSIIKHFDHVLDLMYMAGGSSIDHKSSSMGHSITSTPQTPAHWPPNQDIIEAAGGVGFGCLEILHENRSPSKKRSVNTAESAMEVSIPPIIRCLHPKLVWKSYSKCRSDPLFLYKNVNVCESCYLVYAEFITMLLRLDGNLNALLGPEPSAAPSTFQSSRQDTMPSGAGSADRPRSADWRAMSALNRSRSDSSAMNDGSSWKESSTGGGLKDRVRRPPAIPEAIRRGEEATIKASKQGSHSSTDFIEDSIGQERGSSKFSLYDPEDIRMMVQEREKHFFREVARNPNLKNQHPLMHLITTQKKLSIAEQQSGLVTTMGASKASAERLFGSQYGQSGPIADMKNRFATYKTNLKVHDENLITETRKFKETSSLKQGSLTSKSSVSTAPAVTSEASKAHMEYLRSVMSRLEDEVEPLSKTDP